MSAQFLSIRSVLPAPAREPSRTNGAPPLAAALDGLRRSKTAAGETERQRGGLRRPACCPRPSPHRIRPLSFRPADRHATGRRAGQSAVRWSADRSTDRGEARSWPPCSAGSTRIRTENSRPDSAFFVSKTDDVRLEPWDAEPTAGTMRSRSPGRVRLSACVLRMSPRPRAWLAKPPNESTPTACVRGG